MALCGGATVCNCAFHSSSLIFDGSGNPGDPLSIETYEGIVADDSEIATPFLGQRIYETTTGRLKVYDGTNWVIYGGEWPGFQIERQTSLTVTDNTTTAPALPTEIYDTDAFHASSDAFITIPSGLGGDYLINIQAQWASSSAGYRFVRPVIASNTVVSQNNGSRVGGYAMTATVNNGFSGTEIFRLEPGATITLNVFQLTGGDLTLHAAALKGIMLRHDPSLT